MSGGSFNYIAERLRATGELGTLAEYRRLAAYLLEHGHHEAALTTNMILAHLREARRLAQMLTGVHHAVEWHVSGDSGPETVSDACGEFHETARSLGLWWDEEEGDDDAKQGT